MKNIFRILSVAVLLSVFGGCTKNFGMYNTDPYAVRSADPEILLPTMIDALMYVQQNDSQMVDQMVGTLGGYFTLSNRWGGQNFDTFNASDGWNAGPYETPFLDIYANYFEIEKYTSGSGHYYALATLVRAAVMMRVSDCYGPIPYSQVKDGKMYVAYDSNEDVYKNIIADLKSAAGVLYSYATENGGKPLGAQDAIYSGDYAKWAKFANSLIMRAALRSGDQQAFVEAYESPYKYISTNDDNAMMDPKAQRNPYDLASESWGDLRANASIVDYMNGYKDPRIGKYFSTVGKVYVGMRSGKKDFEKNEVSPKFSMTNFEETSKLPVFVAAESQFQLAEAVLKGWIQGNAKTFYEQGIRLSMEQWKVDAEASAAYIADMSSVPGDHKDDPAGFPGYDRETEVRIAWDAESSDEKHLEQIITQKWIANYPMGIEAWSEWRRTGYPELTPVIDNLSGGVITDNKRGMRRLRYSFNEKSLNKENYPGAVQLLGGADNEATDLFWAKKNN